MKSPNPETGEHTSSQPCLCFTCKDRYWCGCPITECDKYIEGYKIEMTEEKNKKLAETIFDELERHGLLKNQPTTRKKIVNWLSNIISDFRRKECRENTCRYIR
jgi:hypothetical protein